MVNLDMCDCVIFIFSYIYLLLTCIRIHTNCLPFWPYIVYIVCVISVSALFIHSHYKSMRYIQHFIRLRFVSFRLMADEMDSESKFLMSARAHTHCTQNFFYCPHCSFVLLLVFVRFGAAKLKKEY